MSRPIGIQSPKLHHFLEQAHALVGLHKRFSVGATMGVAWICSTSLWVSLA
jgi:hypothetical protein